MKNAALTIFVLVLSFSAARGQATKWTDYSSKDQEFTIAFPGEPNDTKEFIDQNRGYRYMHTVGDNDWSYMVMVFDGPQYAGPFTDAELKSRYDAGRDGGLKQLPGAHLINETDIKIGGISSREVVAENDQFFFKTRYVLTRRRLYIILVLISKPLANNTAAKNDMVKYFDSFHFN